MAPRPRKIHVYRLLVTYPPRSHWTLDDWDSTWVPEAWNAEVDKAWAAYRAEIAEGNKNGFPFGRPEPPTIERDIWPGWPVARHYFNKNHAERRADLFRKYGATVTVVKSKAVEW